MLSKKQEYRKEHHYIFKSLKIVPINPNDWGMPADSIFGVFGFFNQTIFGFLNLTAQCPS